MSVAAEISTLNKEIVFLILQFFEEKSLKQSAHMLRQESGLYFDLKFFEEKILSGKWDEAEGYLSGFTDVSDNRYSLKIYFEIRKQSFLEALDKHDRNKALEILMKDLKVFAPGNEQLLQEMTRLLTIDDIREHPSLSTYGDTESARKTMMLELKKIIMANPLLHGKLDFPNISGQRLSHLLNQSLNWQHLHCKYPQSVPDIRTLYEDHVCPPQAELRENNPLPAQGAAVPVPISSTSWKSSPSTVSDPAISKGSVGSGSPTNLAATDGLKASALVSFERPLRTLDGVTSMVNFDHHDDFPETKKENEIIHESCTSMNKHDLPKTVTGVLSEVSSPTSMDFHPIQQTFLLVGTSTGDIALWDIKYMEKLVSRNFDFWNIGPHSMSFQAEMLKDPRVSVNCVTWSPDGSSFGVAYSKHIVQLYSYHGGDVKKQLEIDAHAGAVNDLAFSSPEKQLLVITCGDDKTIKVWDAVSGIKKHTFEGHDAPVYSVCSHSKEHIHFIFSTSVDGKIKAWLYDDMGARVDYEAPGLGCTVMAYGADDKRLFSCGTSKKGESFLVEWNESEGSIKKRYEGLQTSSSAVVQFDISKSKLLAAGDDHVIKFWDMENDALLTTINAGGGLPAKPRIRFNKEGWLLAVIANGNKIKILATNSGLKLLHRSESYPALPSGVPADNLMERETDPFSNISCAGVADGGIPKNRGSKNSDDMKSESTGAREKTLNGWKLLQISSPRCKSLMLPPHLKANKISRLIYTNAGNAILALLSNAMHLLWKWPQNNFNLNGKETAEVLPQLWQPRGSSRLMINDLTRETTEDTVSCFALSKNDSYLMSASGGKLSLFNLVTFKTMATIMPAPPVATCVAFYPQDNNVVAIGMDDCTIIIYNVRLAKVISKLESHSEPVTGLAFSSILNVLVSSGVDAQIVSWNVDGWEKQKSKLQIPPIKKITGTLSDTFIQFHQDQTHLLIVHETHLAILDAKNLVCVKQWVPGNSISISHATFSSDSQIVYACFMDGTISIFDASNLELHCQMVSTDYLPPSSSSVNVYPCIIAAHPQKPTQFAVGLTDGRVVILEPPKPGGKWAMLPPHEKISDGSVLQGSASFDELHGTYIPK